MISAPSFSKINLALELLGERPDGYVEIRTIFQTIDLTDTLRFERAAPGTIEVTCDDPSIPDGEGNLVWRAARLFSEVTGVKDGARIRISKRIPSGAGLGGGSGNAAVTILALERLWGTRLAGADRHSLAARLGSDVPFFLYGGTALGLGRGEEIYPLAERARASVLVGKPPFSTSTREAYARARGRLTPRCGGHTIWRFAAGEAAETADYSFVLNELETLAPDGERDRSALIGAWKGRLGELGAAGAGLCGSGSALFGIFPDGDGRSGDEQRDRAAGVIESEFPELKLYRCETLDGESYRRAIREALAAG